MTPVAKLTGHLLAARLRAAETPKPSPIFLDGVIATADDLAGLTGLTQEQISLLARQGVLQRLPGGKTRRYPVREAVKALILHFKPGRAKQDVDVARARVRQIETATALADVRLRLARAEVVAVADAQAEWIGLATALRAALLAVPARVGADAETTRRIDAEIRAALDRLADDASKADFLIVDGDEAAPAV